MESQPRRKPWFLWSVLAFIAFIGVSILLTPPSRARQNALRVRCQSNLKQISLACLQYAQDYDDAFPPVAMKQGGGWGDLLAAYNPGWSVYQCPEGKEPSKIELIDYFYNARLARRTTESLKSPKQIILFGDGQDNCGTDTALEDLPRFWVTADESPAKRHLNGANYAFADGHVKWVNPHSIPQLHRTEWNDFIYTFAVK